VNIKYLIIIKIGEEQQNERLKLKKIKNQNRNK
jgi:hypothetical protein